ncbi:neutral zinc metallopeptidase [Blastochloris viridis]|uniref:Putative metalloprotease n=1 Tax=Blastochloris viridis TaxID=1079 RepID=A0A0H5BDN5_BLAVI|nr:neutral zinc metallopeptidase [Blastochloris viridis]ALK10831.1 Putative neutral zinc metallopeptidase [Blastochloris viridis]BAR99194.1 YpfJ protein [Blastochloris viridis]CUU43493.1 putative metalloprotease [Blastochloris viridis]
MRWEDFRRSDNVEDRRGDGDFSPGGSGGFPGGRGGLGIGGLIVVGVIAWATGINPALLIGGLEMLQGGPQQVQQQRSVPTSQPTDKQGQFAATVLAQTEDVWKDIFRRNGQTYSPPRLVLYTRATQSACGLGQSAMGPFYCPNDRKVYLDLSFFNDLSRRFGAPGEFAAAYVIAHEIGHHVQNLRGVLGKTNDAKRSMSQREANALSVRVELQADCYAGIWAYQADSRFKILEQGDVEQAIAAASAIGDDRLQQRSQGRVVPDSFTHGSSKQRVSWFTRGLRSGDVAVCDTFQSARPQQ